MSYFETIDILIGPYHSSIEEVRDGTSFRLGYNVLTFIKGFSGKAVRERKAPKIIKLWLPLIRVLG